MVTTILLTALALGFLGSFHCIGMCGPIALTLPVQHLQGAAKLAGIILYNFGRVITYSFLGALFGLVGRSFQMFGFQQILSIVLGVLLIGLCISSFFQKRFLKNQFIQKHWNRYIVQWLTPLFHKKDFSSIFLIGLLNGLLPCGLVYMAIAGALATGNVLTSALFMGAFGLGTMPAMMAVSFAGGVITLSMRNKIKKTLPYIMGIMGILLVLRGLNLNIPYLSPMMSATTNAAEACH